MHDGLATVFSSTILRSNSRAVISGVLWIPRAPVAPFGRAWPAVPSALASALATALMSALVTALVSAMVSALASARASGLVSARRPRWRPRLSGRRR